MNVGDARNLVAVGCGDLAERRLVEAMPHPSHRLVAVLGMRPKTRPDKKWGQMLLRLTQQREFTLFRNGPTGISEEHAGVSLAICNRSGPETAAAERVNDFETLALGV